MALSYAELVQQVNAFAEWIFDGFEVRIPRGPKVINDAVLGNMFFAQHEIAVIDSPLLQRLKNIKQLGLVFQVYPSATHSRFEHSLGVATIAERVLRAIQARADLEGEPFAGSVEGRKGDLPELRLAALLHDIGHGLCSHLSEQIYEAYPEIEALKHQEQFAKNNSGEILSYLILKSPKVDSFLKEVISHCGVEIDLGNVAEMILGKHPAKEKLFLAQIISSPFDADKLDYIARDSYYCGLALTVDLPRFYSTIATVKVEAGQVRLGRLPMQEGTTVLVLRDYVPLEQILFSKMALFGSVYHHQKVKCLDHMLRSFITHVYYNRLNIIVADKEISFSDPVEYLYATDLDFFGGVEPPDPFTTQILDRLKSRNLLVRCLEISRSTVNNWNDHGRENLRAVSRRPAQLNAVERAIYEALPSRVRKNVFPGEVLLSVPQVPNLKPDLAFVQSTIKGELIPVELYFPIESWSLSYAHIKWKNYVYGPHPYRKEIRDAAIDVLRKERLESIPLNIDISPTDSDRLCKTI